MLFRSDVLDAGDREAVVVARDGLGGEVHLEAAGTQGDVERVAARDVPPAVDAVRAEAARALGCAETTVSWRIFMGRRKLRQLLGDRRLRGGGA